MLAREGAPTRERRALVISLVWVTTKNPNYCLGSEMLSGWF